MNPRFYSGEFMISPAPVHLDGNWCSHACTYCFANLNQPSRRNHATDVLATCRAIDSQSPKKLPDRLIANGHTILASNTVDPFSESNKRLFQEYFGLLDKRGGKYLYQTKGGDSELIESRITREPATWYISLTGRDTQKTEPGAPSHEQRMELIRELTKAGHHVIAGINPYHKDLWGGHPHDLVDELGQSGVKHAWVQDMHLSQVQIGNMKGSGKDVAINIAKNKKDSGIFDFKDILTANGFNVMMSGDTEVPGFWDEHYKINKFWPTMDSWRKHLDGLRDGKAVVFSQQKMLDYFTPTELAGNQSCLQEIVFGFGRQARNLEKKDGKSRRHHYAPRSMAQVFDAYWNVAEYSTPMRYSRFALLGSQDGETILQCDSGKDLFVYDGSIQAEGAHKMGREVDYFFYV